MYLRTPTCISDHPSVIIDSDAMFNETEMFSYSSLRGRASARGARTGAVDRDRDPTERERDRESIFRLRERRLVYWGNVILVHLKMANHILDPGFQNVPLSLLLCIVWNWLRGVLLLIILRMKST